MTALDFFSAPCGTTTLISRNLGRGASKCCSSNGAGENSTRLAQVEEKEAVSDMATGVPEKRRAESRRGFPAA